ncbi:MAG: hypothetical protein HQ579_00065 [Candidatus Omnitrophica bacterium]|nr:hypothetical protein [Candidatus Omnitrophota bacterium]
MRIKKKSILVIVFSSVLISFVLIATLIGFYLYLNWKADVNKTSYYNSIRELNAALYKKYIEISDITFELDKEWDFYNKPIIEGHISNSSNKKISYLKLRLTLSDKAGRVLYMDEFHPLKARTYFGVIVKLPVSYLAPGDSISFKHFLKNCPEIIVSYLELKNGFAKTKETKTIDVRYKVVEVTTQ